MPRKPPLAVGAETTGEVVSAGDGDEGGEGGEEDVPRGGEEEDCVAGVDVWDGFGVAFDDDATWYGGSIAVELCDIGW